MVPLPFWLLTGSVKSRSNRTVALGFTDAVTKYIPSFACAVLSKNVKLPYVSDWIDPSMRLFTKIFTELLMGKLLPVRVKKLPGAPVSS